MTTQEKAKQALGKTDEAVTALSKAKKPGTMLGLKSTDVKGVIEMYKPLISQALPKHLTAERIIQVATTLISRTPEIAECSVESLLGAVMQSSILGFEPIPALGQCYYVPFNNSKTGKREVQFLIGYKGLIDLARRSSQIKMIYVQSVFENDEFSYEFGLKPDVIHKPALGDRGNFICAYAVAKFVNGGEAFEVMSKADIDKIRSTSQAANSKYSPWNTFYEEMAKKTVLRRLAKMLPLSIEHQRQLVTDEAIIKPEQYHNGEPDLNMVEHAAFVEADEVSEVTEEEVEETKPVEYKEPTQVDDVINAVKSFKTRDELVGYLKKYQKSHFGMFEPAEQKAIQKALAEKENEFGK